MDINLRPQEPAGRPPVGPGPAGHGSPRLKDAHIIIEV